DLALLLPLTTQARERLGPEAVEIRILDQWGRPFEQYPARRSTPTTERSYLEAKPGAPYAIQIRNRTGGAIGLVIAVDGRNIISGQPSELHPEERMYILGPGQRAVYRGWRTGQDRINRFYFTDEDHSYAGAWKDFSAMGVIAVAAFQEAERYRPWHDPRSAGKVLPRARPEAGTRGFGAESNRPGTGFGDKRRSPSRPVEFYPQARPFARQFIHYEWRQTLCRRGIIDCRRHRPDRLWGDKGFAPYPPGYRP
ncbi:MAG: hypothetical protein R3310_09435, partial [Candidatus Competibacteraceae bacterium]|nr:hypothetical protein [Candidatus Competibacteraceae bacterium]